MQTDLVYNPFTHKFDMIRVPDHGIKDRTNLGKLELRIGDTRYAIAREIITTPDTPTLTAGGTFTRSKAVTIACTTSGVTIRYTLDGSTPTDTHGTVGTSFTLNQDASLQSKTYTVKAVAIKNGEVSDVATQTYTINRQVNEPTIGVDNTNKYKNSHVVTITQAAADTIYYTTDGSNPTTQSDTITSGGTITLNTAGTHTVKAMAVKDGWSNSSVAKKENIIVGAPKCYIGQAGSVSALADIQALANSYEKDTLVGYTAPTIDFGDTTEYVWFAIPNTAAKTLTIKSQGFGVTLADAAGTVINGYRVWRTANKINSSFTFEFS